MRSGHGRAAVVALGPQEMDMTGEKAVVAAARARETAVRVRAEERRDCADALQGVLLAGSLGVLLWGLVVLVLIGTAS
jgi:hypothetical protein